ncbi:RCC1 domain-containing protein [Paenibacillus glycinis]|uniref:RCC1 repeat- and reductase domain-containing protein n=1 Tax=Paenibacillus glycinis TaxID=2697035 RepID=A0ABW9XKI1_9BACL|nr:RCC1 repeat- and reductase domain-containing protein [Paenibacillus glycinis]NBD23058.1 RCC1 repeat- and reductase domain-containing protein [Paenibacillus glycinis]
MIKRSQRSMAMVIIGLLVSLVSVSDIAIAAEKTVQQVEGGAWHTIALQSDGTVWTWGDNSEGQLGDGSKTERDTPVQVEGVTDVVYVAAGTYHSLALRSDGTVWAWGWNVKGQIGNGSTKDRTAPVQTLNVTEAVSIAAGYQHSLALKQDGTVLAWGDNEFGQLGVGDDLTPFTHTPVQVQGLDSAVAISAGSKHSLALKDDGTVWAWGYNGDGQLGDGSTKQRFTPVQVEGLNSVVAIAAGDDHNFALKQDGTVWAWGYNKFGELGVGDNLPGYITPVQVQGLDPAVAISGGLFHSLAVKDDGTVWTWGNNWEGQLGDGSKTERDAPVQVEGLTDVVYVAAGGQHSLAIKSDGTLWSWGLNRGGQLGDGTETGRVAPVQVYLKQTGSFQLSDSKSYEVGGSHYEYLLYYGSILSPGQYLSGSWSPPEGFRGTVTVSMISTKGEDYDLTLETVGENNRSLEKTKEYSDGSEFSKAEVPEGFSAEWSVKGHSDEDYSQEKVFVYVTTQYDDH